MYICIILPSTITQILHIQRTTRVTSTVTLVALSKGAQVKTEND